MRQFITLTLLGIFLFVGSGIYAQQQEPEKKSLVLDGAFHRDIIREKEPLPYPNTREADVIWSKKIWRVINLREKANYPLYYPTEIMQGRKSLVQALVQAVQAGKITAYDTDSDEFTTVLPVKDLTARFGAEDRTRTSQKMDGSGDTTIVIRGQINWDEVQELMIKEEWFFDTHYSTMSVRIIGICPIRVFDRELRTSGEEDEAAEKVKQRLFWIYYPEARKVLANTPCFVGENEISQISFDDLFLKRFFNSYIVGESNPQNNRKINTYTRNDFEMLLESERIKKEIFNWEHDLWEY
jgi:gliding motility associated protien GldN